jgi:hypothetical protein
MGMNNRYDDQVMNTEEIKTLYNEFLSTYNAEETDSIWKNHSSKFQEFWNNKIINPDHIDLTDGEIDEIVRILDQNAKGNKKGNEHVAKVMIPQGAWRRMFKEINNSDSLAKKMRAIFLESNQGKKSKLIDQLYKLNDGHKNNLTGKSGNAISAMLCAWDPLKNLSSISLKHRKKLIDYFKFEGETNFENDSVGEQIVKSNDQIINGFKSLGLEGSIRTIYRFFYQPKLMSLWHNESEEDKTKINDEDEPQGFQEESSDKNLFYLESHLEDFLIVNWDKTELGKKYDLITEDGELVSQQYRTEIGTIDLLVKDKKSEQLVIIELKKDQSSDKTIGQLARYMGWIEENKTNGKPTKGIIISGHYDNKLYYALKKMKDVEVYLYEVDFNLKEFKGG